MKTKILTCMMFAMLTQICISQPVLKYREIRCIDADWKFYLGDIINGQSPAYNDSSWRKLNLPHDWSIEGDFNKDNPGGAPNAFLPTGIGWYRKSLTLPENISDKKILIQFDGVYMNSDLWVNGHFIGRYPNGFNSFYYDISEFVKPGKNCIAMRVDNSNQPSSRWYTGSGIYRHVWLTIANPLHIDEWGVSITTPEVSVLSATIDVDIKLRVGAFPETKSSLFETDTTKINLVKRKCKLITKVYDNDNKVVAEVISNFDVWNFSKHEIKQEIKISNPKLWSVESPLLYKTYTVLVADDTETDDNISSFGIRKLTFDATKGFMLNDIPLKIKGACIHQDAGALGRAVPKKIWVRKFQLLKDMGCNAIRNHCANSPEAIEVCDSIGLLVFNDVFDEWSENFEKSNSESPRGKIEYGYNKYFDQWCETDLRNLIRRDRNHPSVFLWSLGNEIPEAYIQSEDATRKLKKLIAISHEEDPTRPNTMALEGAIQKKLNDNFTDLVDITGFNYINLKNPETYYSNYHKKHPDRVILGTETYYSLDNWLAVKNNPYVIGQFMWVGFDYLGDEASEYPIHAWQNGLIDINLHPKPEYFFRQSLWTEKPMVYLVVGDPYTHGKFFWDLWDLPNVQTKWNWDANSKQNVNCYTNCEEAELFLNGKSVGTKYLKDFPDCILKWDVSYQPGELKVVGKNRNKQVCSYQLATAGTPSKIKISTPDTEIFANGSDIAVFDIEITDQQDHFVFDADNLLTFKVEGEGKILAASNANQNEISLFRVTQLKAFHGRCQVCVQSTDKKGEIQFTVKSAGLKNCSIQIISK
jgi:beta-galactosidase